MYRQNETISNIEDIVLDFLMYRREKQSPIKVQSNYQIGRGWPYYKGTAFGEPPYYPEDDNFMLPPPNLEQFENDGRNSYSNELYSEINQMLMPCINEVLNEYEYEGSPIYDENMSKEELIQIIDKVLKHAATCIADIKEIYAEPMRNNWGRYKILRSLIEFAVINEIFNVRQPKRRRRNRNHFSNNWGHDYY